MYYSMVLVDDDPIIRNSLRSLPIWEKLCIDIVFCTGDGQKAYEYLQNTGADILLTDVKMPLMDGLELAKRARELHPAMSIAFISGYDDFDYLKQALQLQAVDYILKPIDVKELEKCIQRIVLDTEQRNNASTEICRLKAVYQKGLDLSYERFLYLTMISGVQSAENGHLNGSAPLNTAHYIVVVKLKHGNGKAAVYLPPVDNAHSYPINPSDGIFAVLFEKNDRSASDHIRALQELLKESGHEEYYIVCTMRAADLRGLHDLYRDTMGLLRYVFCSEVNTVVSCIPEAERAAHRDCKWDRMEIQNELLADKSEELCRRIEEYFEALRRQYKKDALEYIASIMPLIKCLDEIAEEQCTADGKEETLLMNQIETLQNVFCFREIRDIVISQVHTLNDMLKCRDNHYASLRIDCIKQYIQNHFAEDIGLKTIAREVGLASNYMCVLFRQSTGMTINSYLTEIRITEAKRMLADVNMKLYDICSAVGYENPSYFTRLFHKTTGLTPTEYRNRCVSITHDKQ